MRPLNIICVLACLGSAAGSCAAPTAGPASDEKSHNVAPGAAVPGPRPERMLRAALRLTANGLEVVSLVEATNTTNRRDPQRGAPTFWRSYDASGSLVEERGFRLETSLRLEHPGLNGELSGRQVPLDEPVFDVAVPLHPGLVYVRFFRAAPGEDRERAFLLGELEVPQGPAP